MAGWRQRLIDRNRRTTREHWEQLGGSEYLALQHMQEDEALRVYKAAGSRLGVGAVVKIVLLTLPISVPACVVMVWAQNAGFGMGGKLLLEAAVHLALAPLIHPYAKFYLKVFGELYRPALRSQLLAEYGDLATS